jgi:citrate synthase
MTLQEADATPVVTIAGREWPIPVLAPRQNRIVVPGLLEIVPRLVEARKQAHGEWHFKLDTVAYDRLTDVVYHALTRATPELTRPAFDDMPVDTTEMITALFVIARQAGLFTQQKDAQAAVAR